MAAVQAKPVIAVISNIHSQKSEDLTTASKIGQNRSSSSDQSATAMSITDYYCAAPGQQSPPIQVDGEIGQKMAKRGSIMARFQKRLSFTASRPQRLDGKRPSMFSVDRDNPDSELERQFERVEVERRGSGDGLHGLVMM